MGETVVEKIRLGATETRGRHHCLRGEYHPRLSECYCLTICTRKREIACFLCRKH